MRIALALIILLFVGSVGLIFAMFRLDDAGGAVLAVIIGLLVVAFILIPKGKANG